MQPLDYSLLNKKGVVICNRTPERKRKSTFMDENVHNKLFADDKVNDYINAQIQKASKKLDEELKNK